jgi:hypothetical protein
MLTVKVYNLPQTREDELMELHKAIVDSVRSIPQLGIEDQGQMMTLFPKDMMYFGSGTTILVEITGLNNVLFVYNDAIAKNVGEAISSQFITAQVVCSVSCFTYNEGGYWQNR